MPDDYEEMDFTIENEEWNEYELKDGVTIRGRIVLQKIIRDPYKPDEYSFNTSKPMWVICAPSSLRGAPNWKREEGSVTKKFEVRVNRSNEPWNVYRVTKTGQKLK